MTKIILAFLLALLASPCVAQVTNVPCNQLPALTGAITTSAGSCATGGTVPIANGGTGITAGSMYMETAQILVDFSVAGDNAITVQLPSGYTQVGFCQITISNASADISAANFGVFTTTGGGGTALLPAATAITVTNGTANTNNNFQSTNCANVATEAYTPSGGTVQFRVGTTAAAGRTAKVYLRYWPIP